MAGGPGGREVGRVSIKIAPDSSDFIGEVRRLVKEAEGQNIKVGVEVDAKGVRDEVRAATAGLDEKVTVDVDAETGLARTKALDMERYIKGLKPEVKVGADTGPAKLQGDAIKRRLDSLAAQMSLDADPSKALAEYDRLVARARDLKVTVNVDADTGGAVAKIRAMSAAGAFGDKKGGIFSGLTGGLETFLGLGAKVPGVIGSITGGLQSVFGVAVEAGKGFFQLGTTVFGMSTQMAAAGGVFTAVAAAAIAAAAGFAAFGGAAAGLFVVGGAITAVVGAIASAVSALPGLLVGSAGALGVLAIAFSNFGDALGRGKHGAALEKQNKALAALPPPARDAANAINGVLLPAFDRLRTQIQTVFFQGFGDAIRNIANTVMPQLSTSLQGVSASLSGLILGMVGVATSADGIANLNVAFDGMARMLAIITPSMNLLTQALIDAAGTSGLWRVLGEIIAILVARVAELFARFSEGGGASLMVQSLTQLRDVLNAASGAFVTLAVGAAQFFTAAGPGLVDVFNAINNTLKEIDFAGLGASFGMFASAVGRFIDLVPPALWQAIADAVRDLALKFQELSQDPAIQQFFVGLVAMLPLAIDAFRNMLGVIQTVIDAFHNVAQAVAPFLEAIGLIPPGTADAMSRGVANVQGAQGPMSGASGAVGKAGLQGVLDGMGPMPPEMRRLIQESINNVGSGAPGMGGAGTSVGTAGAQGARAGIAPMPGDMRNTTGQARDGVASFTGAFGGVGRAIVNALANAISGGAASVIAAAVGIARAAWTAAKNFLGIASPSRLFRDTVGAQIPAGMAQGIDEKAPLVTTAITDMIAGVRGSRNVALGYTLGQQIGTGMQSGIGAAFDRLPDVVRLGSVSSQLWDQLLAGGWRGDPTDGMEALYRPGSVPAPGSHGNSAGPNVEERIASTLAALSWSVDLDPEGVARIAARGDALRKRR